MREWGERGSRKEKSEMWGKEKGNKNDTGGEEKQGEKKGKERWTSLHGIKIQDLESRSKIYTYQVPRSVHGIKIQDPTVRSSNTPSKKRGIFGRPKLIEFHF